MLSIAHIINPCQPGAGSDLVTAQPITFASMLEAQRQAHGHVNVELYSAAFPEDHSIVPSGFLHTPPLTRAVLDVAQFAVPRRLPLIGDIISALVQSSNADYFIYTNVDIALMPTFYLAIRDIIASGVDACIINRRTIPDHYTSPSQLPLMYAEVGHAHPGRDCFVFSRAAAARFNLGLVCIGATAIGKVLAANMLCNAQNKKWFGDYHLTFHVGDRRQWTDPAYVDYAVHNTRELIDVLLALDFPARFPEQLYLYGPDPDHPGPVALGDAWTKWQKQITRPTATS